MVAERPDACDLALYRVPFEQRADARGRARRDKVTGVERHDVRDVADEEGDGEGHGARAPALPDFAVDARFGAQVCRVESGYEVRADGAEGVEGLGARKLNVLSL